MPYSASSSTKAQRKSHSFPLGLVDFVKILMEKGADIHAKDIYHESPLDLALKNGHKEIADFIIVNFNLKSNEPVTEKTTPINTDKGEKLIKVNWKDALREAICKGNLNIMNELQDSTFRLSCQFRSFSGDEIISELLIKNYAGDIKTIKEPWPLHLAVRNGHEKLAKMFIQNGCDINQINLLGMCPIHEAASRGISLRTDFRANTISEAKKKEFSIVPLMKK